MSPLLSCKNPICLVARRSGRTRNIGSLSRSQKRTFSNGRFSLDLGAEFPDKKDYAFAGWDRLNIY